MGWLTSLANFFILGFSVASLPSGEPIFKSGGDSQVTALHLRCVGDILFATWLPCTCAKYL